MNQIHFRHTDAWILLSIPVNEHGCDLEGLISTADYINHAIPALTEIEEAINRFLKAGIIEIKNNFFKYTEQYRAIFIDIEGKNKTFAQKWEEIETYLTQKAWFAVHEDINYPLEPALYQNTYTRYFNKK